MTKEEKKLFKNMQKCIYKMEGRYVILSDLETFCELLSNNINYSKKEILEQFDYSKVIELPVE